MKRLDIRWRLRTVQKLLKTLSKQQIFIELVSVLDMYQKPTRCLISQLPGTGFFIEKKKPTQPVNTGTRIANWKTNHLAWTGKTRVDLLALAM